MQILLASTSIYRKQQLEQLGIDFDTFKTDFDESKIKVEFSGKPKECAIELSEAKALNAQKSYSDSLIIAGDQVASFDSQILSKTMDRGKSIEQLLDFSGKTLKLFTAMTVLHGNRNRTFCIEADFKFRQLSRSEIEAYVDFAKPEDCAGSFKIEKGGIALFDEIHTEDFSSIQGIPLVELSKTLREFGVSLFHRV